jgi:hypothetical protein
VVLTAAAVNIDVQNNELVVFVAVNTVILSRHFSRVVVARVVVGAHLRTVFYRHEPPARQTGGGEPLSDRLFHFDTSAFW